MSRTLGLLILAFTLAPVAGCGGKAARPDLPDAGTAVMPQLQIVERIVYVPVPAWLTEELPMAEGPLAQCPSVAAARRAALEKCNGRLRAIDALEGTRVEATDP